MGHGRNQLCLLLPICTLLASTAAGAPDVRHEAGVDSSELLPVVVLCHRAPGHPVTARTIRVAQKAVPQHLAHGDLLGACVVQCGNGVLDSGEACDDGNTNPADGCDNECHATQWITTTVVGALDVVATSFGLGLPSGVALDSAGRIYIADYANNRVERIDGATLTRIAGTGVRGFSGDGGPATAAQLYGPSDVTVDGQGRIYIADGNNNCVRRIDTSGFITTIAGACGQPFSHSTGDGGPAREATFGGPVSVAVDALGRVYIADYFNNVVRRIDETGIIDRVAGTGNNGAGGDGGPATSADIWHPVGVSVDAAGALYIADSGNAAIRKVDHPGPPSQPGTIHTVAGVLGDVGYDPDGPVATTRLFSPGIAIVDANGVLTLADTDTHRVLQVIGSNIVTVAGGGRYGFSGDGGPATSATLAFPQDVAVDATGRIVIADSYNNRIRRVDVDATRTIDTIAGSGAFRVIGDHAAATSAPHLYPTGIAVDAQGNVYLSDGYDQVHAYSHGRVRRVDATGTITTIAGTEDANASPIVFPQGIAVDSMGRVYVLDLNYWIVWRVDASGLVRIAGGGTSTDEGALATDADLAGPNAIAFDSMDRMYLSATFGQTIRRVDVPDGASGTIVTVAGGGSDTGDTTGPGAQFRAHLNYVAGMAFDTNDRLYITDAGLERIVRVDFEAPSLTRIAGGSSNTQSGENVPPLLVRMTPGGIVVDAAGNIYFVDEAAHRVRRVDAGLTAVTTVAGSQARQHGDFGDGGPATGAVDVTRLLAPVAVAIDPDGRLLIADAHNHRVRRVDTDGIITTIAGDVSPEGMGQVAQARLADPRALALADGVTLVAGGSSGTVQAVRGDFLDAVIGRYPQTQPTEDLARFRDRTFGTVSAIAADPTTGTLYVVESDRIHSVAMNPPSDPHTWTIAPFANHAGTAGYADGEVGTAAFRLPGGLYHDGSDLYVADTGNHAIRQISGSTVVTIAGQGEQSGFGGDGGPALDALLDHPQSLTKCPNGDLFLADTANHRVRRVQAGVISTVVGIGVADSSGDGAPAMSFPVNRPKGLACDAYGNLYVSSTDTVRMLPAQNGIVDGTGPVHTIYGPSKYTCLTGLVLRDSETLQVADQCTGVLVELHRQTQ